MSSPPKRSWQQRLGYDLFRIVSQWVSVTLLDMRSLGRHHVPSNGGGLLLSSHQSHFDPVLVGLNCNRRLNYLARKTLFKNRLFAGIIRFLDAIEIDREGGGFGGLRETIARLGRGELVLLFPEGTRSADGNIAELKSGFLVVAKRANVPLIPVAVVGAFDVLPRGTTLPRPIPSPSSLASRFNPTRLQRWMMQQFLKRSPNACRNVIAQVDRACPCVAAPNHRRQSPNSDRAAKGTRRSAANFDPDQAIAKESAMIAAVCSVLHREL